MKTLNTVMLQNETHHTPTPTKNGKYIVCGNLPYGSCNSSTGELVVPENMVPYLLANDLEDTFVNILEDFHNGTTETINLALFNAALITVAIVRLKRSNAGNVVFDIKNRFTHCIGLYGFPSEEETLPEPQTRNKPSYTCFKDFVEYGGYVGVVKEALRYNRIILEGGLTAEFKLNLNIDLPLNRLADIQSAGEYLTVIKDGGTIHCQWLLENCWWDVELAKICEATGFTLFDLYKIKLKTERALNDSGEDINTYPSNSYGITRLYKSHNLKGNSIVAF